MAVRRASGLATPALIPAIAESANGWRKRRIKAAPSRRRPTRHSNPSRNRRPKCRRWFRSCRRRRSPKSIRPRPRTGPARRSRRRPTNYRSAIRRRRCIRSRRRTGPARSCRFRLRKTFKAAASTPPPGTPPPNTLPLGTVPHGTLPIAAGDPYAGARHQGRLVSHPARGRTVGRIQHESRHMRLRPVPPRTISWPPRNSMYAPTGRAIR